MPYRAGAGSGLFGSHTTPPKQPMVDVGGAIDSLTQGASSLIRQAYEMKQAKAAAALRQQEFTLAQQREGREQQREDREASNSDREFDLKSTAERHRFIENGGIPSSTTTEAVPAGRAAITPLQPSPITTAMGQMPPVRVTPSAGDVGSPIGGTVPVNTLEQRTTPESYDATKAGTYQRTIDAATIREAALNGRELGKQDFQANQQRERLAAQQSAREYAAGAAKQLAQWKQSHPVPRSAVARAMTAGQEHTMLVSLAAGYLQQHGGYSQDALDTFRNTPEGQQLAKAGVAESDLLEASTKLKRDPATGQILSLINTGAAADVGSAAKTVFQADSAAKAFKRPVPTTNPGPAQPGVSPSSPGAGPPDVKTPSKVAGALVQGDDFTDDEVKAAYAAGKRTDKDLREWIVAQRSKKGVLQRPRK